MRKSRLIFYIKVSGFQGAGHIAKHLKSTGVQKLEFVLDEGYFVLEDMVEGVDQLVSVYVIYIYFKDNSYWNLNKLLILFTQ